jgi:hypothetical protein
MKSADHFFLDAVTVQQNYDSPYEEYCRYHWLLKEEIQLRQDFAYQLNLCLQTFQRWEREILSHPAIVVDYLGGRLSKHGFDKYQRFILIWIYVNKFNTNISRKNRTYESLQLRLRLLMAKNQISRENFYEYLENKNDNQQKSNN